MCLDNLGNLSDEYFTGGFPFALKKERKETETNAQYIITRYNKKTCQDFLEQVHKQKA